MICSIHCRLRRSWGYARLGSLSIVAFLLAANGCGLAPPDDPSSDTLPSTVTDGDDDGLSPAGADNTAPEPHVEFTAAPVFCCNPLSIDFTAELVDGLGGYGVVYEWDFGDGHAGRGAVVNHTYVLPGEYAVAVQARIAAIGTWDEVRLIRVGTTPSDAGSPDDDPAVPDDDVPSEPDPDDVTDPVVVARAGADKAVASGSLVMLDGTDSTVTPSQPVSYLWRELSGAGVTLGDPSSAAVLFTAPEVLEGTLTLVFELTVTTGSVSSDDTVEVYVVASVEDAESYGTVIEFLAGPSREAAPGTAEVSWRFLDDRDVSEVYLRVDACLSTDIDGSVLAPNADGVYTTWIDVPADQTIWYVVQYQRAGVQYSSRSVYVNPPPGDPDADPAPVIWYHLYRRDLSTLSDALRSGVITHVMIAGADRVEVAYDRSDIQDALALCRDAGVQTIWSRHLWNGTYELQTIEDTWDPQTYVGAIQQINTEAAMLGVDGTAIDCEPYGLSPLVDYFFAGPLPEHDYEAMRVAMETAVAEVGVVDYVHPVRAQLGRGLYSTLPRILGGKRITTSTYYDVPSKNCRMDYPYEVFGAFVQVTTERPDDGERPWFLPFDIVRRQYLWSAAAGAPGARNGLMLYPGNDDAGVAAAALMLADFLGPR